MLNFRFDNDNNRNPYAYAQTSSDAVHLAERIERLAQASPEAHNMIIHVVTPKNYWPLPWLCAALIATASAIGRTRRRGGAMRGEARRRLS